MTSVVTSQPDPARCGSRDDDRALSNSTVAGLRIAEACLTDGPLGQVGLELEAHCFDLADPGRRPEWAELRAVIADVPELPGGSAITVEPGGAVELSAPPAADPVAAIAALAADRETLRAVFAAAGFGLALLGTDPLRPARRVHPGGRYAAMEQYFIATRTAGAGAAMMTSTASVQVNLDAGPRAGWTERVRLAHALGPTMIAIAANSPMLAGRFTGWVSTRQRVWGQLDSARCGPILGASVDPATDWARYALKAPVMLVHTPDGAEPLTEPVPFADWADGLALLGGRRPTAADLDYHLTTLFPPVRPRGFLEIRYLDSLPDSLWPAVVFLLATLLDDPSAAAVAAEAVEPVATAWNVAARVGLADKRLHAAATRCVDAVADKAPAELTGSMQQLVQNVERGRCAGDDFSDQVIRNGIASAVLATGESG